VTTGRAVMLLMVSGRFQHVGPAVCILATTISCRPPPM
jgi:hypothetical protein